MPLEAAFHPTMLYVNNLDKPGFIGALGTMLGEARINIATFNLGRVDEGEDAIALVGVDQPIPEEILAHIAALPQVRYAKLLRF
jgi:D-3-phosphoglycerate dehydrogenase